MVSPTQAGENIYGKLFVSKNPKSTSLPPVEIYCSSDPYCPLPLLCVTGVMCYKIQLHLWIRNISIMLNLNYNIENETCDLKLMIYIIDETK